MPEIFGYRLCLTKNLKRRTGQLTLTRSLCEWGRSSLDGRRYFNRKCLQIFFDHRPTGLAPVGKKDGRWSTATSRRKKKILSISFSLVYDIPVTILNAFIDDLLRPSVELSSNNNPFNLRSVRPVLFVVNDCVRASRWPLLTMRAWLRRRLRKKEKLPRRKGRTSRRHRSTGYWCIPLLVRRQKLARFLFCI